MKDPVKRSRFDAHFHRQSGQGQPNFPGAPPAPPPNFQRPPPQPPNFPKAPAQPNSPRAPHQPHFQNTHTWENFNIFFGPGRTPQGGFKASMASIYDSY